MHELRGSGTHLLGFLYSPIAHMKTHNLHKTHKSKFYLAYLANIRNKLGKLLTPKELTSTVFSMANSKFLGPNGVTIELFKALWHIFGTECHHMLLQAIGRGKLFGESIAGLIILLHKGGSRSLLNNC